MPHFPRTLSAVLRGRWMIHRGFAESQLPLILSMLNGGNTIVAADGVARSGAGEFEMPFFIDPRTMQRFNWGQLFVWNSESRNYVINSNIPEGIVAIVPVTGPIMKLDGECGEAGSISRSTWLLTIDNIPQVTGVVLLIDSPGGMVDGTSTFRNTIKSMAKYTIAYIEDGMACSAAYWIASACKEIWASKNLDTLGSIGVYTSLYDFSGYFEKMGVKVISIYAPQSTEKNIDYRQALAGDTSLIEADLKTIAGEFIESVRMERPAAAKSIDTWSTGASFYANEGKRLGLLDGIAPLTTIIKRASQSKIILQNRKN